MEEEIIYFYNVKDGKYYQSRYTHRWLNNLQQQCKKQKEVIDRIEKYIEKETRIYGLSMSIELGTHFDNILGILKGVE